MFNIYQYSYRYISTLSLMIWANLKKKIPNKQRSLQSSLYWITYLNDDDVCSVAVSKRNVSTKQTHKMSWDIKNWLVSVYIVRIIITWALCTEINQTINNRQTKSYRTTSWKKTTTWLSPANFNNVVLFLPDVITRVQGQIFLDVV